MRQKHLKNFGHLSNGQLSKRVQNLDSGARLIRYDGQNNIFLAENIGAKRGCRFDRFESAPAVTPCFCVSDVNLIHSGENGFTCRTFESLCEPLRIIPANLPGPLVYRVISAVTVLCGGDILPLAVDRCRN